MDDRMGRNGCLAGWRDGGADFRGLLVGCLLCAVIGLAALWGGCSSNSRSSGAGGATGQAGRGAAGTDPGGASGIAGAAGSGDEGGGGGGAAGVGGGRSTIVTIAAVSATGPDRFYGVAYGADGSIFTTGQVAPSTDSAADFALVVAKFTPAGALDPTFGDGGYAVRNVAPGTNGELFRGIVVQSTGKVVVSGTIDHAGAADARDRDVALVRFNANGTKDPTFGVEGVVVLDFSTGIANGAGFLADSVWGLARYPDDRLIIHGGRVRAGATDTDFLLARFTADGAPDPTFGVGGQFTLDTLVEGTTTSNNASPRNVTILPGNDGVLGAGYQPVPGADTRPVVFKVTDAGVLDATFGVSGVFSQAVLMEQTECYTAAIQPQANGGYGIVTTGYGRQLASETSDVVSLRLRSDGVLDPTYGTGGLVRVDVGGFADNSRHLAVLPDARVLLVGGGRATSADVDGLALMLLPDGRPDTSFAPAGWRTIDLGGPADFLWSVALSPDRKTAAIAGIRGVGSSPSPATLNDDGVLVLLPIAAP